MRGLWQTWFGQIRTLTKKTLPFHPGGCFINPSFRAPLVWQPLFPSFLYPRFTLFTVFFTCLSPLVLDGNGEFSCLTWNERSDRVKTKSGAGYTFGSGVVRKFLSINNMSHILRAHQLCMEGFSVLYDNRLSTVWSAPNYCYRCGNSASILEVGPGGSMHFNVFEAAPENERDGPSQQQMLQNGGNKVRFLAFPLSLLRLLALSPNDLLRPPLHKSWLPRHNPSFTSLSLEKEIDYLISVLTLIPSWSIVAGIFLIENAVRAIYASHALPPTGSAASNASMQCSSMCYMFSPVQA